jgi:hypothetical protein
VLQAIRRDAFSGSNPLSIVLPAGVSEIDSCAFVPCTWHNVTFDGPSHFLTGEAFLRSADSKVLWRCLSHSPGYLIPAEVEVIGCSAFLLSCQLTGVAFENGSKLREIAESAFSGCVFLKSFNVPSSVETLGRCCFAECSRLTAVTFEANSRLKTIGKLAFSKSVLISITIPAATEAIEGSAFANSPIIEILVSPGNRNFKVNGKMLLSFNGNEIVRYFGTEGEVFVPKNVEVLRTSSFESCHHIQKVVFENESKLRTIGFSALGDCISLMGMAIPASVDAIEDEAFRGCHGLESCLIDENGTLVKIGKDAFSGCHCLESFSVPRGVEAIGQNSFKQCASLRQLKFQSAETLRKVVGNATLDEFLGQLGFTHISSLFRIEVNNAIIASDYAEWFSGFDESSHLKLSRDTR